MTEREEAGRTPFTDAQVGIRETLMADRLQQATDDYLAKLRQRTPVWTVFDDRGSSPLDPQFTAGRPSPSTTR